MTDLPDVPAGTESPQVPGVADAAGMPTGTPAPDDTPGSIDSPQGTAPGSGAPGDYLERVRTDTEFAVEQIRQKDRAVTGANQRVAEYKELDPYISALGSPQQVAHVLTQYDSVLGNPKMREMVNSYLQTGAVPTVATSQEPGIDSYEEPTDPAIEKLQAELSELRGQLSQQTGAIGKQNLVTGLQGLKARFPEDYDTIIEPYFEKQIAKWEQTPDGRKLLASLDATQLESLAFQALGPHYENVGERVYRRKLDGLKQAATDAPAATATTGREAPTSTGFKTVREAMAEARALERRGELA